MQIEILKKKKIPSLAFQFISIFFPRKKNAELFSNNSNEKRYKINISNQYFLETNYRKYFRSRIF